MGTGLPSTLLLDSTHMQSIKKSCRLYIQNTSTPWHSTARLSTLPSPLAWVPATAASEAPLIPPLSLYSSFSA